MIRIIQVDLIQIDTLRNDYLNSLPEFQELYVEMMITRSDFYELHDNEKIVGYAIITSENVLIEFYLKDRFIPKCTDYFNKLTKELSIKNVYCKSFDYLLLNCCLMQSRFYSILGSLFRDFHNTTVLKQDDLSARHADLTDLSLLLQQQDGINELFETDDQIETFIKNKNLILFFKQQNLAGCGTILKTHVNWDYYDIGVWVNLNYRKQGIATQITTYLREYCLKNNWKPICGCAIENIASQKTLEKSGFISKHKLIDFKVTG